MKNKKLLLLTACVLSMGVKNVSAATSMPAADANGVVKLTEDVTLSAKYLVAADKTMVIDLNGFTLTGPTTNYAIDNRGKLEIKNGKIVCPASTLSYDSSCIRNYKELSMNEVDVNASWTALKNEEASTITITKSKLFSDKNTAGVIMNYGTALVEDSEVIGNNAYRGAAIYALSYAEGTNVYNSTITVKGSSLSAYAAVLAKQSAESKGTAAKQEVFIEDGTVASNAKFEIEDNSALEIEGEITAPIEALNYAKDGTKLIVNSLKVDGEVEIPKSMTVTFKDGTDLSSAVIKTFLGATIINQTNDEVKVIVVDNENKEVTIPSNTTMEIKKDEVLPPVTDPDDNNEPEDPTVPDEDNKPDNTNPDETIDENPKTNDGIVLPIMITLLGLGSILVAFRKVLLKR